MTRLRRAAFLTLDKRGTDRFYIGLACLVAANQVADIFAVISELTGRDLSLYPAILLDGNCDRFACRTHKISPALARVKSYY